MRESERKAMGRDDKNGSAYEFGTCQEDRDYWHHDSRVETITRFHIVERRAI